MRFDDSDEDTDVASQLMTRPAMIEAATSVALAMLLYLMEIFAWILVGDALAHHEDAIIFPTAIAALVIRVANERL